MLKRIIMKPNTLTHQSVNVVSFGCGLYRHKRVRTRAIEGGINTQDGTYQNSKYRFSHSTAYQRTLQVTDTKQKYKYEYISTTKMKKCCKLPVHSFLTFPKPGPFWYLQYSPLVALKFMISARLKSPSFKKPSFVRSH